MFPYLSLILLPLLAPGSGELTAGQKITIADKPIDIRVGHLVPAVTDWNGDGKPDLLLGQFVGGKIGLYLNEGAANAPVFKKMSFLTAGDKEITLPCG